MITCGTSENRNDLKQTICEAAGQLRGIFLLYVFDIFGSHLAWVAYFRSSPLTAKFLRFVLFLANTEFLIHAEKLHVHGMMVFPDLPGAHRRSSVLFVCLSRSPCWWAHAVILRAVLVWFAYCTVTPGKCNKSIIYSRFAFSVQPWMAEGLRNVLSWAPTALFYKYPQIALLILAWLISASLNH